MLKKLGLLFTSTVCAFAMHTTEININEKDLGISAKLDMGQFNQTIEPNTTFIGAAIINGSDDYSQDENGYKIVGLNGYYELNFLMRRAVNSSGFTAGLGMKINHTKMEDSFISVPLGLELGYTIPSVLPVIFGVSVYYAPESLSFQEGKNFLQYQASISVELIQRASIVTGFRTIHMKFHNDNETDYSIQYNTSSYFGFRFQF